MKTPQHQAEAEQIVSDYFQTRQTLLRYIGAEHVDCSEYEFDVVDDVWDFVGGCRCSPTVCKPQYLIWGQGSDYDEDLGQEVPLALTEHDCTYRYSVRSVRQTPYHTVVFCLGGGGQNFAFILDNQKRFDVENHLRDLRKMGATFEQD